MCCPRYSYLTNHLRNRSNGAELLTQLLNPYFHFVIDIIEKSGGDVVRTGLRVSAFVAHGVLINW